MSEPAALQLPQKSAVEEVGVVLHRIGQEQQGAGRNVEEQQYTRHKWDAQQPQVAEEGHKG